MQNNRALEIANLILRHPLSMLVIGMFCTLAFMFGAGAIFGLIFPKGDDTPLTFLVIMVIVAVASMIGYSVFVRFIERSPVKDFAPAGGFKEWLLGIGVGFGAMALVVGTIALFGGYKIVGTEISDQNLVMLAAGIGPGVYEEIISRGLIFRFVEKWLGSWASLAISSLFFGFMHLSNDNSSLLAATAISLEAGILLAAVYMYTRRLWAAIGLHMAWNYTQGGIFDVPVSGHAASGLIDARITGPELLTGGAFGAEASIPAIIICTGIGLYFLWRAHKAGQFVSPSWHRFKFGTDSKE